jgi:predicted ester cyclase
MDKAVTALASAAVALAAVKLSGGRVVGGEIGQASTSQYKAVVRKLYREVWNQSDKAKARAAAGKFISEDHILIDPSHPNPTPGVDAYMQMAESLREAMTKMTIVVDDLICQNNKVVAQISYEATVGGKEARWTGPAVMEIEDGKIVRSWVNSDSLSALIQLGLLQDVAAAGSSVGNAQFERAVTKSAGPRGRGAGAPLSMKDGDLKVVQALLGRSEAHPETVLTGNDWLQYFDKVVDSSDDEDAATGFTNRMRVDSKTGLDMVV